MSSMPTGIGAAWFIALPSSFFQPLSAHHASARAQHWRLRRHGGNRSLALGTNHSSTAALGRQLGATDARSPALAAGELRLCARGDRAHRLQYVVLLEHRTHGGKYFWLWTIARHLSADRHLLQPAQLVRSPVRS